WLRDTAAALREARRNGTAPPAEANERSYVHDEADVVMGEALDVFLKRNPEPDAATTQEVGNIVRSITEPDLMTLREAVKLYLAERAEYVRPQTFREKERYLGVLMGDLGASTPLRDITRAVAGRFTTEKVRP